MNVQVKIGRPSRFYARGREISPNSAYKMYRRGVRFGTDSPVSLDGVRMFDEPERTENENFIIYKWRNTGGEIHRDGDMPAVIWYYRDELNDDGSHKIMQEKWYKNGELHRDGDMPAHIEYYHDTNPITGTQKISGEEWYKDGELHRYGDLPAGIQYRSQLNDDGTQKIIEEAWFKDGELHRDGWKPAAIEYDINGNVISEHYWVNGRRHNLTGPAVRQLDDDGTYEEYYIDGEEMSQEEYDKRRKQDRHDVFNALNEKNLTLYKKGKRTMDPRLIKHIGKTYAFGKKKMCVNK